MPFSKARLLAVLTRYSETPNTLAAYLLGQLCGVRVSAWILSLFLFRAANFSFKDSIKLSNSSAFLMVLCMTVSSLPLCRGTSNDLDTFSCTAAIAAPTLLIPCWILLQDWEWNFKGDNPIVDRQSDNLPLSSSVETDLSKHSVSLSTLSSSD